MQGPLQLSSSTSTRGETNNNGMNKGWEVELVTQSHGTIYGFRCGLHGGRGSTAALTRFKLLPELHSLESAPQHLALINTMAQLLCRTNNYIISFRDKGHNLH